MQQGSTWSVTGREVTPASSRRVRAVVRGVEGRTLWILCMLRLSRPSSPCTPFHAFTQCFADIFNLEPLKSMRVMIKVITRLCSRGKGLHILCALGQFLDRFTIDHSGDVQDAWTKAFYNWCYSKVHQQQHGLGLAIACNQTIVLWRRVLAVILLLCASAFACS